MSLLRSCSRRTHLLSRHWHRWSPNTTGPCIGKRSFQCQVHLNTPTVAQQRRHPERWCCRGFSDDGVSPSATNIEHCLSTERDFSLPLSELNFTIDARLDGFRIDLALTELMPHRSRKYLQSRIRSGAVSLIRACGDHSDKPDTRDTNILRRSSHIVRNGDKLTLLVESPTDSWIDPGSMPLNVLLETEHLIACNKLPYQLVHPAGSTQSGTLLNALHARHKQTGQPASTRPRVLHRLDANTSGVVVFAKGINAAVFYGQVFENKNRQSMSKQYLALLDGKMNESVTCALSLGDDEEHEVLVRRCVRPDGKPAFSTFAPVASNDTTTLAQISIKTGRQHQIRVHSLAIGFPVVGDTLYNPNDLDYSQWLEGKANKGQKQRAASTTIGTPLVETSTGRPGRQLLHAWKLTLPSFMNYSERQLTITAPVPSDFRAWAPDLIEALDANRGSNNDLAESPCLVRPC